MNRINEQDTTDAPSIDGSAAQPLTELQQPRVHQCILPIYSLQPVLSLSPGQAQVRTLRLLAPGLLRLANALSSAWVLTWPVAPPSEVLERLRRLLLCRWTGAGAQWARSAAV